MMMRPIRESLKNLIRSVGLRAELFSSAQEFLGSKHPPSGDGKMGAGPCLSWSAWLIGLGPLSQSLSRLYQSRIEVLARGVSLFLHLTVRS
jgi:hypothetical protein